MGGDMNGTTTEDRTRYDKALGRPLNPAEVAKP